jgi:hypothetical protein
MERNMKRLCTGLTVILVGVSGLSGTNQTQIATATEDSAVIQKRQDINLLVGELKATVPDKNSEESRILNQASGAVRTLIQLGTGKTASRRYLYSIELDHSLLKGFQNRKDMQLLKVPTFDLDTKHPTLKIILMIHSAILESRQSQRTVME